MGQSSYPIPSGKKYRKIPKISSSMYKPPKPVTQKTLRSIAPPNISPPPTPGGLYLENCPQIQSKTKENTINFLPTIRLAQSILKHKFPSVDKPLPKKRPSKRAFKKYKPRPAYFRNFTVCPSSLQSLIIAKHYVDE